MWRFVQFLPLLVTFSLGISHRLHAQKMAPQFLRGSAVARQYSDANMIVSTRVVFSELAGSSEPPCMSGA